MAGSDQTLRQYLRAATAHSHDKLDHAMRDQGGWEQADDYARFLQLQHAARVPVEAWLEAHAPVDLRPPRQTGLIANDLTELGANLPSSDADFAMDDADDATFLGAAWVLAGSSLGNRSILAELKKRGEPAAHWPHAFLGDDAMLAFWKRLRARIEQPVPNDNRDAAGRGARAVFDHFITHTMSQQAGTETLAAAS
ncbi:MAG: biliverdin-producing heme oxygenase [Pseudomonadota bacterium]